jgi:hypothetical protein
MRMRVPSDFNYVYDLLSAVDGDDCDIQHKTINIKQMDLYNDKKSIDVASINYMNWVQNTYNTSEFDETIITNFVYLVKFCYGGEVDFFSTMSNFTVLEKFANDGICEQ